MSKQSIYTDNAPKVIGIYSQAIKKDNTIYLSGQIPLIPETMLLANGGIEAQLHQVFKNLKSVAQAAGGDLCDLVKITIFLTDLNHFSMVNSVMANYFVEPYPARVVVGVTALPKSAAVEIDGVMVLNSDTL